jgi:hypothetical protein
VEGAGEETRAEGVAAIWVRTKGLAMLKGKAQMEEREINALVR